MNVRSAGGYTIPQKGYQKQGLPQVRHLRNYQKILSARYVWPGKTNFHLQKGD